ncbi:DELTA-thalatoxin-Avl1a-like [Pempheris klunzingeri]|uniref:DELTA-thalatoxin-Avl1a-like n=1 Tax=Pempheris klunzingeri TaxID=3127111 RepID=UPI003980E938
MLFGRLPAETGFAHHQIYINRETNNQFSAKVLIAAKNRQVQGVEMAGNVLERTGSGLEVTGNVLSLGKDIAKVLPTHRQCTVYISNECSKHTLCNPRVHTESGRCFIPLPPTIKPSATGDALFSKTANTARGSVGVFTYDLLNNSTKESTEKIAVMFKVPFDLNLKSTQYALGLFGISTECDRDLFREMSKNTNTTFIRGKAKGPSLTHTNDTVTMVATMSDCYQPVIRLQVSDN